MSLPRDECFCNCHESVCDCPASCEKQHRCETPSLDLISTKDLILALTTRCDALVIGMFRDRSTMQSQDEVAMFGSRMNVRGLALTVMERSMAFQSEAVKRVDSDD